MHKCKYVFLTVVSVFAAVLAGCATGDSVISPDFHARQPERIAIVEVSGDIRGNAPKNQVADFFSMELLGKGYRVIERSRVESVLAEQDFQRSEVTTTESASRMGEILNVPAVAMVDVDLSGEKVSLTGRIVETDTGEVLWIGTGRAGSGRLLATLGGAAAGAGAGSQVGGGSGRTAGVIGGAVLGGAAGDTLAPQTTRVVQRAIQRMIGDLPPR